MAFVAGHNTTVEYDNAAGTLIDISAYVNSLSGLGLPTDILETTAFGDGSKTSIPGLKAGSTVGLSGDFDATLNTQMAAIAVLTTSVTQTLKVSPAGTGSGDPYVQYETLLEDYSFSSDVGGKVTWSATLRTTGAVTTGTN